MQLFKKKIYGSKTTTSIISNKVVENMKVVKSLEDSGLLIKGVGETIQKNKKEYFF